MDGCKEMTFKLLAELNKMSPDAIERVKDKVLDNSEIKNHEELREFMKRLFDVALKRALKKQKVLNTQILTVLPAEDMI